MSVKILLTIINNNIMKRRSHVAELVKQTEETFTAAFFDESSKCWMENKKRKKNGDYVYKPDKIIMDRDDLGGRRKKNNSQKSNAHK
jgi:UTP:GlnB (protein PII) uridylyltransferase